MLLQWLSAQSSLQEQPRTVPLGLATALADICWAKKEADGDTTPLVWARLWVVVTSCTYTNNGRCTSSVVHSSRELSLTSKTSQTRDRTACLSDRRNSAAHTDCTRFADGIQAASAQFVEVCMNEAPTEHWTVDPARRGHPHVLRPRSPRRPTAQLRWAHLHRGSGVGLGTFV